MQHYYYLFIYFLTPVQYNENWIFLESKSGRTTSILKGIQTKSLNLFEDVKVNSAKQSAQFFYYFIK